MARPSGRAVTALPLLALLAGGPAAGWEPFVSLDSFAHAEPLPVSDFIDEWQARLRDGSDAVTRNRFETGVRRAGWSLGYIQRYDYEIKATRDTAELYHQVQNNAELPVGRTYDLDLRAWHQRSDGLRGAYAHDFGPLRVKAGLSLLRGWTLTDGSLSGTAVALAPNEYGYEARVDYVYSEDALFDRQTAAPSGQGVSLDLAARWSPSPTWTLDVSASDVFGFIQWKDAPYTGATATSDTREFDEDGFVRFRPALSGREANRSYRQRLHPEGRATLRWEPAAGWAAGSRVRATEVRSYATVFGARTLPGGLEAEVEVMPSPVALGLGLTWRGLALRWLADDLRFDDARVLQIQLVASHRFG